MRLIACHWSDTKAPALSRYSQDAQCLELAQKIDSAYYASGGSLSTDFWDR